MAADRSLGGLTENLFWSAHETSVLAIEGEAPVLTASSTWSATRCPRLILRTKELRPCPKSAPTAPTSLKACRETTYGVAPLSGYRSLDFKATDLSSEQPLADDPLLGRGRNAQDPYRRLITDEGRSRSRSISGARASGSRACSVIRQRRKPRRRGTSRFLRSR
jgi:hypothetical protein